MVINSSATGVGARAPARDLEKQATCRTGCPATVSIHVPGRLPSAHMESSSWPRNATCPSVSTMSDVPSDSPRSWPFFTCSIAPTSSTLAAMRSEPSRPFHDASTVPTRSEWSCSFSSGLPARLVEAISALVRSAWLCRLPLRGGGGCATPRIGRDGLVVVLGMNAAWFLPTQNPSTTSTSAKLNLVRISEGDSPATYWPPLPSRADWNCSSV